MTSPVPTRSPMREPPLRRGAWLVALAGVSRGRRQVAARRSTTSSGPGMAAHLTGHDEDSRRAVGSGPPRGPPPGDLAVAARHAFWLGMMLAQRGEVARGGGWLARAGRLVEEHRSRHGRARVPARAPGRSRRSTQGDPAAAFESFEQAARHRRAVRRPGPRDVRSPRTRPVAHRTRRTSSAASHCSTRRCWRSRPARSRRSSSGSCTAPRSRPSSRSSTCVAPRSGRRRSAPGATRSRTSSRSADDASSIGPSSCSSTAPGPRRSTEVDAGAASGCRGRRPTRPSARRSTSRPSCTDCAATSPRPRRPTARRASGAAGGSPAWRCCDWPRATSMRRGGDPSGAGRGARRRSRAAGCWSRSSRSPLPRAMLAAARAAADELAERRRRRRCTAPAGDRRARRGPRPARRG